MKNISLDDKFLQSISELWCVDIKAIKIAMFIVSKIIRPITPIKLFYLIFNVNKLWLLNEDKLCVKYMEVLSQAITLVFNECKYQEQNCNDFECQMNQINTFYLN